MSVSITGRGHPLNLIILISVNINGVRAFKNNHSDDDFNKFLLLDNNDCLKIRLTQNAEFIKNFK